MGVAGMSEQAFGTAEALDQALCSAVANRLAEAVALRGSATLVISGGSTPRELYRLLAKTSLPWQKITVLLADDRWVALDHKDSNERMVRELLLRSEAASAHFLSLAPVYPDEAANLLQVEAALTQLPTFDVVLLGMGLDGHTASLFPCSAEINHAMATTAGVAMTQPAAAPHRRVTLTRRRLEDSRWGAVHIVGEEKSRVLEGISGETPENSTPVAVFLPPRGHFEVWQAS